MENYADKKRTFREFKCRDWVYLKLHPYVQSSVVRRANHKLAFPYYGSFPSDRLGGISGVQAAVAK